MKGTAYHTMELRNFLLRFCQLLSEWATALAKPILRLPNITNKFSNLCEIFQIFNEICQILKIFAFFLKFSIFNCAKFWIASKFDEVFSKFLMKKNTKFENFRHF